jgi:hypothetical protein
MGRAHGTFLSVGQMDPKWCGRFCFDLKVYTARFTRAVHPMKYIDVAIAALREKSSAVK